MQLYCDRVLCRLHTHYLELVVWITVLDQMIDVSVLNLNLNDYREIDTSFKISTNAFPTALLQRCFSFMSVQWESADMRLM